MLIVIIVALIVGFFSGFVQSLLVGLITGTWDGGTGCLWGLMVAIPSALAAVWLGWWANVLALSVSAFVFALSYVSIKKGRDGEPIPKPK